MNKVLCRQLALDYCCSVEDILDGKNHFTVHRFLDGRRRFQEGKECFLKAAVVNGKLLFSGREPILNWCREQYGNTGGEWFFEAKNLKVLNDRLQEDGRRIEMVHPFYIAETPSAAEARACDIRWYEGAEIEQFRGDSRYGEAFAFCEDAPDVIGIAALRAGEIIGMAGASADSPAMWQIGINVDPGTRCAGIGTTLVALLKNELLRRGILPYYGTSMSHIASQRVALGAGFVPAWAELVTSEIGDKV